MTQFYNDHSKVFVSVDCIIFGFNGNSLQVLIGKRQMDPGRGEWSLYGGFVGQNEDLEDAANRVILELTGMKGLYIRQVGAFGDKRNFRKRIKDIDFIEKTDLVDKVSSKRGATLYRFNKKAYEEDPSFNLK